MGTKQTVKVQMQQPDPHSLPSQTTTGRRFGAVVFSLEVEEVVKSEKNLRRGGVQAHQKSRVAMSGKRSGPEKPESCDRLDVTTQQHQRRPLTSTRLPCSSPQPPAEKVMAPSTSSCSLIQPRMSGPICAGDGSPRKLRRLKWSAPCTNTKR